MNTFKKIGLTALGTSLVASSAIAADFSVSGDAGYTWSAEDVGGAATNDGGESTVLRTYKFYDIWPTTIDEIALSYDTGDSIEEFGVTFKVQYFTVGNSTQSSGSGGEVLIS